MRRRSARRYHPDRRPGAPIAIGMWNYVFVHRLQLRRIYARSEPIQ
ncbi:MAG: hypothetical protein AAF628_00440 [Planctomycetota bacterium]